MNPLRIRIGADPWQTLAGPVIEIPAGTTLTVDLASGGHWYGHGFSHIQPYPLETGTVVNPTFAVNNIQSPVWMCSAGSVLFADTTAVLAVSLNEAGSGELRVTPVNEPLTVRVFTGRTLPEAHAAFLRHVGWPNASPDTRVFGDALFCTWTQYPRCITQARVLDMARQIRAHDYPCSTLILDDRWESCFGELEFSRDFPDPRTMLDELHALGFAVWLWVTPFVNQESANFPELARQRVLVQSRAGGAALFRWWGGTAGLVDVTSPAGRDWLRGKLAGLQRIGVAGFKIDGGDFKYQPAPADALWHADRGASGYSDALLELFENQAPNACETRTAWSSQRRAILWREGGKDSHWGLANGLKALVTLGLHCSLLGYDLLMPDMVPGRVQTMVADLPLPTDELLVRWTEVSAFFPFLQFSYFPWNYATDTEQVVRQLAKVHQALVPYLTAAARNRTRPLLRPLWYDAPDVPELYGIADEFALGPDLIIAPVLDPAANARDVVLPPGRWVDAWMGTKLAGGLQPGFPAPCPGIPVFVRAENSELCDQLAAVLRSIQRGSITSGRCTATWRAGLNRDLNVTG